MWKIDPRVKLPHNKNSLREIERSGTHKTVRKHPQERRPLAGSSAYRSESKLAVQSASSEKCARVSSRHLTIHSR